MREEIDSEGARRAFERLQPRLDRLARVRRMNTSPERAAIFAAAAGRMVCSPGVRERFAVLPGAVFDLALLDELERAALALWHALVESRRAAVRASRAALDPELVAQATALVRRMSRVLAYHLGEDRAVRAELDAIRRDRGYVALATNLMRLARLYEAHGAALAGDTRHHRAADREQASRLAHAIVCGLGAPRRRDADVWAGYVRRAWTLLFDIYQEVRAAGRFLFRHEGADARFPSLVVVARAPRGRAPVSRPVRPVGDDALPGEVPPGDGSDSASGSAQDATGDGARAAAGDGARDRSRNRSRNRNRNRNRSRSRSRDRSRDRSRRSGACIPHAGALAVPQARVRAGPGRGCGQSAAPRRAG